MALGFKPNAGILLNNLGMSFLLKGEYEKAIKSFTEAQKLEPSDDKIQNNLALALCKVGRYQEALEVFKKTGDEASAYNNLGYVYMTEGKHKEAIEAFEKALEIRPGFYIKAYENLNKAKAAYQTRVQ
jgi:Flp pilus assembly protein TadD